MAASLTGSLLGGLAAARRAPAVHPVGTVHRARTTIDPGGHPLFRLAGDAATLVRTSRGAGLPRALPDVLGLALRIEGEGGLDVLMASSGRGRLTRHVPLPGRDPRRAHFSSLLPYLDDRGQRFLVGASFQPDDDGALLAIDVATPGSRWARVGTLTLIEVLADEDHGRLAFDPWRCPAWMKPTGVLNRLRRPAYRASQAARPGPPAIPLTGGRSPGSRGR